MLYTCNGADRWHHPHTKSPSLPSGFFTSADGGQVGLREPPLCKLPRPHAAASASHWFLLSVQERRACESLDIITRAFIPYVCVCVSLFSIRKCPLFLLCVQAKDRSVRCGLQAEFRLLDGCDGTPASSVMAEVRPSSEEKSVGRLQKQPTCGATVLGLAQFSPLAIQEEHSLIVSALIEKFWKLFFI